MSKISYIEDLMSWSNEFSFFEPVKVRFSETDMFGHLRILNRRVFSILRMWGL